jgi:hypothetical protein
MNQLNLVDWTQSAETYLSNPTNPNLFHDEEYNFEEWDADIEIKAWTEKFKDNPLQWWRSCCLLYPA